MSYTYTTTTVVPEAVVREICRELTNNTIHGLLSEEMDLSDEQILLIKQDMVRISASMCKDSRPSVDGWELNRNQVAEIVYELTNYRRIGAIKAFRSFTGAGLRHAKEFIDKFCADPGALCKINSGPKAAVKFQAAFNS